MSGAARSSVSSAHREAARRPCSDASMRSRPMMRDPNSLLLDELTSELDPELVSEVLSVVRQLARDGMTMIVVTHEMAFAREVSNLVVFMDGGRIVAQGKPGEMLEKPRHERLKT